MSVTDTRRPGKAVARTASRSAGAQAVSRHREKLRAQGMRLVQFWAPDTGLPDFQEQARRQSLAASRKDRRSGILDELDATAGDVAGWRG